MEHLRSYVRLDSVGHLNAAYERGFLPAGGEKELGKSLGEPGDWDGTLPASLYSHPTERKETKMFSDK